MSGRRRYWFKAMLLLSGHFAENLDVDRGVGEFRGDLERAAQSLHIASQAADIDIATLLQLCDSRLLHIECACQILLSFFGPRAARVAPSLRELSLSLHLAGTAFWAILLCKVSDEKGRERKLLPFGF